ncbi:hypothetical protein AAVH_40937, partial [Aphelenchoides avenae]
KVSSKKKNARGDAKLRLSVENGPILVFLTITDLHGASRTLRVVTEEDDNLIPIKHPATTIEATAVPFAPDQLLQRLRLVSSKVKEQREQRVQPRAPPEQRVEKASDRRQPNFRKYMKKRIGGQVLEHFFDVENGTMTVKLSGCSNTHCNGVNCNAAPETMTLTVTTEEADYATDDPEMDEELAQMLTTFQNDPRRQVGLSKRVAHIVEEVRAIEEKFPTAKPREKKHRTKELEDRNAEYAKLNDILFRAAETGRWLRVPKDELFALFEKAKQKDPNLVGAITMRVLDAIYDHDEIKEKLEATSNQTKKKRLYMLLGRKEIEFDAAMNEIAAIV